jgi:ABC-type Fe3+-hydroxamate transport system substrate-binding protein
MRIVSLVPSITEALCMLGLEDSIRGITDYCLHPVSVVSSKRRIGGTKNPRLAGILDLRPDLVIINTDENRLQTHEALIAAGLNVLVTQTDSLDEVEAAWMVLGEATGTAAQAQEYRDRIAAARDLNRGLLRGVRRLPTLIPVWRDPWIVSGSGTYMESLLAECGFRNVMVATEKKWVRVSLEGVPAAGTLALPEPPEVVLLPSEPYSFGEGDRQAFPGVRRANIRLVDGVLLSWWLSRTALALEHFRLLRGGFNLA